MFGLLYGLYQYLFSKVEFHLLILGLDGAGKTAFLEQIKHMYLKTQLQPFDKLMPTVGLNIGKVETSSSSGSSCKLIFWDLGGQIGLRTIWDKYFEESHAVIFIIDSTSDTDKLAEAKQTLESLFQHNDLQGASFLLLANKQDLKANAKSPEEIYQGVMSNIVNNSNLMRNRAVHTQAISAVTGDGIREGIQWLCDTLRTQARPLPNQLTK